MSLDSVRPWRQISRRKSREISVGDVKIGGYDILKNSIDARKLIGYLPESVPLYTDMSVKEYLRYMGCLLYTSPSPRDGLLSRMPSSA